MFHLREKGHFSKNCQNKKEKASKLIYSLDLVADEDIESWYDKQDQPDASTIFRLEYIDSSYSSKSDFSDYEEHFPIMQAEEISRPSNLEINSLDLAPPLPNIEVHILPSKYDVPIKAIAFMDTGAQKTLMNLANLHLLPGSLVFLKLPMEESFRQIRLPSTRLALNSSLDVLSGPKLLG